MKFPTGYGLVLECHCLTGSGRVSYWGLVVKTRRGMQPKPFRIVSRNFSHSE